MSKKNNVWRCSKCGYTLPKESDLLKVCPECGAFGEFVKEARFSNMSYSSTLKRDSILLPDPKRVDIDPNDFCCEEMSNLVFFLDSTGFGGIRKDRLVEIDLNAMIGSPFWVTDSGRKRKPILRACPFCSVKFERRKRRDSDA